MYEIHVEINSQQNCWGSCMRVLLNTIAILVCIIFFMGLNISSLSDIIRLLEEKISYYKNLYQNFLYYKLR